MNTCIVWGPKNKLLTILLFKLNKHKQVCLFPPSPIFMVL